MPRAHDDIRHILVITVMRAYRKNRGQGLADALLSDNKRSFLMVECVTRGLDYAFLRFKWMEFPTINIIVNEILKSLAIVILARNETRDE